VEFIKENLKEAMNICEVVERGKEDLQGKIVPIKFNGAEYQCYFTKRFILLAVPPKDEQTDVQYLLSFTVNNYNIQDVAWYTHILSLYFQSQLSIHEDNYIDEKNKKFYFGPTAYTKFEEQIHTDRGFVKCPVCERYVPRSIIDEQTGYCKICGIDLPNSTFH